MSVQVIPLTASPNQSLIVHVSINGQSLDLYLYLHYNEIAGYWVMTVRLSPSADPILDSVPFITGQEPAGNILGQFDYLGIGGMTIINTSQGTNDYPDNSQLGTDFQLIVYDN
jgi:hypothetical protein